MVQGGLRISQEPIRVYHGPGYGSSVELTKAAKGKYRQKGSETTQEPGGADRAGRSMIKPKAHVLAAVLGAALHLLQLSAEKQSQN